MRIDVHSASFVDFLSGLSEATVDIRNDTPGAVTYSNVSHVKTFLPPPDSPGRPVTVYYHDVWRIFSDDKGVISRIEFGTQEMYSYHQRFTAFVPIERISQLDLTVSELQNLMTQGESALRAAFYDRPVSIHGGSGGDLLKGSIFGDLLDGGLGFDYASYGDATSGVIVRLDAANLNTGEAAGETYINIEGLIGSSHDDVLVGDDQGNVLWGGAGTDWLYGQGGNDYVVGGSGADVLDGGAGFDFASYDGSTAGVFARLDIGKGSLGDAERDTYTDIEGLIGSPFADILVGDGRNNEILGGAGVDHLTGGAGADLLNGGDGFDFARYELASSGVVARLDLGTGLAGDAQGDGYVSIEGLLGSEFDDVLVGTTQGNFIFGIGGHDFIYGGGGSDELYGGAGSDKFAFRASDLAAEGIAIVRDFTAEESDLLLFEGVAPGSLTFYESGADVVIAATPGRGVVLAGATLAELEGHLLFT